MNDKLLLENDFSLFLFGITALNNLDRVKGAGWQSVFSPM